MFISSNATHKTVLGHRSSLQDRVSSCNDAGWLAVSRNGRPNGVGRINDISVRCARLVLGWVTIFGLAYHLDV